MVIALPIAIFLVAANLAASACVLRAQACDTGQKRGQIVILWLVPVIGAMLSARSFAAVSCTAIAAPQYVVPTTPIRDLP